jgi:hypothetical protein
MCFGDTKPRATKRERMLQEQLDTASENLGETIHCGFRKAIDGYGSDSIWRLIIAIPGREWASYLDFVRSGLGLPSRQEVNKRIAAAERRKARRKS